MGKGGGGGGNIFETAPSVTYLCLLHLLAVRAIDRGRGKRVKKSKGHKAKHQFLTSPAVELFGSSPACVFHRE